MNRSGAKQQLPLLPLLFGALAIGAGLLGRMVFDQGQVIAPSGTTGMLLWILSPALLGFVFRRRDAATRRPAQGGYFAWHERSARAAAVAALAAVLAVGLVIAIGLAWGSLVLRPKPLAMAQLLPSALGIALFAFLEESGWRGYLLPSLLARTSYLRVLLLGALIWFAWHLPYLDLLTAAYSSESLWTLAPRLLLGVLAMQWLYIELFLRWPSIWPAFALHASMNISAQLALAGGLALSGPQAWLFSPSADGLLVMALCTAIGGGLYRARTRSAKVACPV
ncbi:CPBP family intramembrane metalloprotease [Paucibacter sp. TC2R-5]|uniref:CPBP family intramembrane glutamic endopeptidase n=1 Tax=Paucibacter sp. TC2R-5 TaxID=2893555 RepID=UPI0021E35F91|nr:CPBP family intramembrane glutamic endopeptidase [Paucibacter sp. TC2R-5]MCV2360077.1 CPBP family intramembrane metalloprotease [Paucibacter sp. TC2R-5]